MAHVMPAHTQENPELSLGFEFKLARNPHLYACMHFSHPLLQISFAATVQVIHDLLQALQSLSHLVFLPL